jgi:hypothetical protein
MPAKAGIQNSWEKPDSRSPTKSFEDKFHGNDRWGQKVILRQVLLKLSMSALPARLDVIVPDPSLGRTISLHHFLQKIERMSVNRPFRIQYRGGDF